MKALLTITACLEAATGLALLAAPSALASALLGSALETSVALAVARVAGAALISLALACWLARNDTGARFRRGVTAAMLVYNSVVVAILVHAALGEGLRAPALWPAAVLHSALAAWCLASLAPRAIST